LDGSWIDNYLCNQCLSPLMLWVRISIRVRCTTLCDKVCQWLATGRWFSPVSSTNKTDRHDKTEILLKVALSTKQTKILFIDFFSSSVLLDHYSPDVKPPPSLLVLFNQLLLIYSFLCSVLQIIFFIFVIFLLTIVLCVLRITASDYQFGIFKLFLIMLTTNYVFLNWNAIECVSADVRHVGLKTCDNLQFRSFSCCYLHTILVVYEKFRHDFGCWWQYALIVLLCQSCVTFAL